MNLRRLKLELFYIRKSLMQYHALGAYVYNRWWVAPKLLRVSKTLSRPVTHPDFSMHILTSHRDVVMAVWALASWYAVSSVIGELYIHDDGSLTESDKETLQRLFVGVHMVSTKDFVPVYADSLRPHEILQKFRSTHVDYFSFKKIIDPFFASEKSIHLIVDSDILWFSHPDELASCIADNATHSCMQENNGELSIETKSGTSRSTYNAGIVLYAKNNFDIPTLEHFFETLDITNRNNLHFADQFGYSQCLKNLTALPAKQYTIRDSVSAEIVARHYTSPRRPLFYIEGIARLTHLLN